MTVLTAVMIAGLLTLIVLFVMRFPAPQAAAPLPLPEALRLPEGAAARAVTYTGDRLLVVTEDGRLLIYDADGTLLRTLVLTD